MKFAFIILGNFESETDHASIKKNAAEIVGVASISEACEVARRLQKEGVACMELCGAFEEEGAKEVIKATGGQLPVGFVVHLPEQNKLFDDLFG